MNSPPPETHRDEEILGKAYDTQLMLRLWVYVKPHYRLFIIALVLIPATVAFEIAQPYLLSTAIDDYIAHHKVDGLGIIALIFLACVIMQALLGYAQIYALQLMGQRSMHGLRLATYRHILTRRAAFFDKVSVGRLLTRMTNDVENVNEMFASGVVTLIADGIRLTAIVGMMFYLNTRLTLITFITVPALFLLIRYARQLMRSSYRQIRVMLAAMNTHVQEHLSGIAIIQLFVREKIATTQYDDINAAYRKAYEGSILADASMYAIVEAIGLTSVAAIAWFAGNHIGESGLTIGLVVAFIEYVNKFFVPIKDFSTKYAVMQSAMAAAERIIALLNTEEVDAPSLPRTVNSTTRQEGNVIEFDSVKFSYREGEPILKNLSLAVGLGEKVAVVGATGSGKSTVIKVLTRLYDINSGVIFLNGENIMGLKSQQLRHSVTVVNQDVFLFSGTIADNIRMGRQDASDADIHDALRRVGADSVLQNFPDGIESVIENHGNNLSAGERQLITFARALVRDPQLLILDEATAHIDPNTESLIEHGLDALMKGRTTLVVAHRLSTVRNADKIIVLDKGVLVEQGTYGKLMAASAHFAKLQKSFSREE